MKGKDYFKDKKVTVMGLGLLGRGVGDVAYIASAGAKEVVVTDLKSEEELAASVAKLAQYKNVRFVLGEHREEDFVACDLVLVSAGVPFDSPYLAAARAAGVPLKQSAALFAELSGIPIIGVTGTRGKSTVTHMIHHTLSLATGEEVLLGGNVRGVSNLQLLNEVREDSLCVMELDSWQLQGFGWAELSPQIAVFTNFMDDHLNYYKREGENDDVTRDRYFADKANIFLYQEESGVLVTTPEVFETAKRFATGKHITLGQEVVLADASTLPEDCVLSMPGAHNRLNAALAYEALKATSLPEEVIFEGLATFPGVEGRMQFLGSFGGVKIFNDNNATTPQAVKAGVEAIVALGGEVVLICGGADKGLDIAPLIEAAEKCKAVVTIPGTGTSALTAAMTEGAAGPEVIAAPDLRTALEEARLASTASDTILFSPGFASFGAYKNEYERNDEFLALVAELQEEI